MARPYSMEYVLVMIAYFILKAEKFKKILESCELFSHLFCKIVMMVKTCKTGSYFSVCLHSTKKRLSC